MIHAARPSTTRTTHPLGVALACVAIICLGCNARGNSFNKIAEQDSSGQNQRARSVGATPAAPAAMEQMGGVVGGAGRSNARAQSASEQAPVNISAPTERKIIRNGNVRFEVADTDKAVDAVKAMVAAFGGYVSSEQRGEAGTTGRQASLSCRIPAARLDEMLTRLKEIGKQEAVGLTSEDISEQYLDLEVHLATQKQLEERLRALLDRSTNKLSDLLEIEKEVARVRGEIDSMEGRKRFWDNQVAFSTLGVTVHEPRPVVAADEGGIWATIKGSFGESADNFVHTIAGLIAALGTLIPLAVALAAAFWFLRFLWRRRRA